MRPFTAVTRGSCSLQKTPKNVDSFTTAFAPMPLAPDLQNTSRERMTRRSAVAECRVEPACLRPNVLTGRKKYPPTRHDRKQDTRSGTTGKSTKINQPETCDKETQPKVTAAEQPRAPNRNTTHTMEGPDTKTISPLARGKPTYLTSHGKFVRIADLQSCACNK